jgi:acetylornithine deacetylase/succinyl-diaminopimelate desuccinylase-like protein
MHTEPAIQDLTRKIDGWRDEIIDFTCELIATPSETPPGDERNVAALILRRLSQLGLTEAITVSEIPERPNVLYTLKGTGGGPKASRG